MPEGDTLVRTAGTLRRWLSGREVTEVETVVPGLAVQRLVGRRVEAVESRGKNLLVHFGVDGASPASGAGGPALVLHTHLRMSGSWHVYRRGEGWRRPSREARVVLACGDRVAVCFNAPVVELLAPRDLRAHPGLARLGPDVLGPSLDLDGVLRRARARPGVRPLGELLLDQGILAGIGNIWRSEALFVTGHHPATPQAALDDAALGEVVKAARRLMRASAGQAQGPPPRWVYRRAGRPCRRCGTLVAARRLGEQARTAYWCPSCQPQTR